MVSRKEIRREAKTYWDGEISLSCVEYLKDLCEEINNLVIKEAVNEFNEINKIRARAGIPIFKRIQAPYLRTLGENILNSIKVFNVDRIGYTTNKDGNNYSMTEAGKGDFYA